MRLCPVLSCHISDAYGMGADYQHGTNLKLSLIRDVTADLAVRNNLSVMGLSLVTGQIR